MWVSALSACIITPPTHFLQLVEPPTTDFMLKAATFWSLSCSHKIYLFTQNLWWSGLFFKYFLADSLAFILFYFFIGSLEIKKLVSLVYFKPNKGKFFFGDQVVGMGPYFLLISLWPYQLGFLRADHMGSFQSVESMLCGQGWEFNKISLYGKKFVNIHEERNEFWRLITMLYFYKHVLEMNKLETRGVSIKINRSNSTKINQNQTNSFDFWIQWNRSNRFTITKRMVWFWIQV